MLRMAKAVKTKHFYVEKRAGVYGGRAVVKGTWIPVWLVFQRYRGGQTPEEIQSVYPHLSPSQIHGAVAYAFDHLAEIQTI